MHLNTNTVLRVLRILRDEGLPALRPGRGSRVSGRPDEGPRSPIDRARTPTRLRPHRAAPNHRIRAASRRTTRARDDGYLLTRAGHPRVLARRTRSRSVRSARRTRRATLPQAHSKRREPRSAASHLPGEKGSLLGRACFHRRRLPSGHGCSAPRRRQDSCERMPSAREALFSRRGSRPWRRGPAARTLTAAPSLSGPRRC